MLTLLTAALLTFADPAGDARGDGGYLLPTRPAVSAEALDLRAFRAEGQGAGSRFTVELGRVENPWGLPDGFSANVTDIFVGSALGGQRELDALNLQATTGGWTYHLRVTGGGSTLTYAPEGNGPEETLTTPVVRVQGNALVIDAAVPPRRWAYWVTSSVYSPLTPDGLLRPVAAPGDTHLQAARDDAPVPVDVLGAASDTSPFTRGILAPVGQTRDDRLLILAALGGLGLLLVVLATLRVWRR
ncbi:glucodextranase DOMON-like domain-containing protein [Deinococcus hopiensis]|uniref:C-terminal binding-module, SLH-like, of glucodextranase n=1 Tax=Deinococcus hopiensis KR-140 TaxID=695939 RepID=A0A1W1VEY8_9DEIO|nr:glucodextranase DOMON-like domain-containing protein [Deinococcus hopiensis]SMB91928.1 C-terminal binding-module, SLH-like, of glucodextranase [Deinococcus hopiensis KR-140]